MIDRNSIGAENELPTWVKRALLPTGELHTAAVLMAALADQTSLPWPHEFPRKTKREKSIV